MALTETISVQTVRRETQHFRLVFTERAWVELVELPAGYRPRGSTGASAEA